MRLIDADWLIAEIKRHNDIAETKPTWRTKDVVALLENCPVPPNTPLTLEELRELKLQEWLWVEVLIPSAFRRVKSGYYQTFEDYTKGEALCCGWPGTIHECEYADYGKTWLAYRKKPEEAKNGLQRAD